MSALPFKHKDIEVYTAVEVLVKVEEELLFFRRR